MKIDQVLEMAAIVRMTGVRENLEGRVAQAHSENHSHLEFLALLLEDELRYRKNSKSERLTKRAKFRYKGELEEWDTSYDRGLSKAKLKELASLNFYRQSKNLIVLGKSGEGKTQLTNAVGRRLCFDGIPTLFYSTNLLFEHVASERASGGYLAFLNKVNRALVLILDDFGLRPYNHDEANILIDLIEERYRKGVVMITSQVSPKGWHSLFEDPVIAEAIIDRLINPAITIQLKGGSHRRKLAAA